MDKSTTERLTTRTAIELQRDWNPTPDPLKPAKKISSHLIMAVTSTYDSILRIAELLTEQYQNAQVLEADRTLRSLEQEIFKLCIEGHSEDPDLALLRKEYLKHKILYDTIKIEAEEVRTLVRDFQTETTDWQETMTDSKGTRVMWKPTKGSPIHTLRLDGSVKVSVFNILAILMEVDLYTTWIPTIMGMGLKDLQLLEDVDRFKKVVHAECAIPWPLANRDVNLIGYGVDLLDQGRVMAVARSFECAPEVPHNIDWSQFAETEHLIAEERAEELGKDSPSEPSAEPADPNSPFQKRDEIVKVLQRVATLCKPPSSSKIVRAKIYQGGFLLTPVSETETDVSFLFQFDPDLAVVPSWLINWGMKHFSFTVLGLLEKAAIKVGTPESPYTQRMADKPEVYDYLKTRLHAFESMTHREKDERRQASLQLLSSPVPLHPELIEKFASASTSHSP